MYLMKTDTYECDMCGHSDKWDGMSANNGMLWECEECGKHFCSKCFLDTHGQTIYQDMLHNSDRVMCADCYTLETE